MIEQEDADAIYDEFEFILYDKDLSTPGIKLMRLKDWLNTNTENKSESKDCSIPTKTIGLDGVTTTEEPPKEGER